MTSEGSEPGVESGKTPVEFVVSADKVDLVEVARRSCASVTFGNNHEPSEVRWLNARLRVEDWREPTDRLELNYDWVTERHQNLLPRRIGNSGVVVGADYVAFVYPSKDGSFETDVVKLGGLDHHVTLDGLPDESLFEKAKGIAKANQEKASNQ